MKKSQLFGLLAALTAVVIFTGCPTDPDIEYRDKIVEKEKIVEKDKIIDNDVMIHIDTLVSDQTGLTEALADPAYEGKVIGYDGDSDLTEAVTIGEKYAVYILNGGDLATGSGVGLTVEGTLWVGYGATLTVAASSDPVVVDGGVVHVVTNGTLSIDSEDSILDGDDDTALGTDAVSIVNGTLEYTAGDDFDDAADITKALGYITKGLLNIGEVEVALKPSVVAGITIPQDKNLNANTGSEAETEATLIIPAGLALTTGDNLGTVTALTVYGYLEAESATLKSDGAAIVVNGTAVLSEITKLAVGSSVAGVLTATVADFDENGIDVAAGATINDVEFPGATTLSALGDGEFTIDSLTVGSGKSLTVAGALTVTGTLTIEGSGDVVLTDDSTKVIFMAGAELDVKDAAGKFGVADQGETLITVGTSSAPTTPTKAKVDPETASDPTRTVTTDGTGTDISSAGIVLGTLTLAFDGTSEVDGSAGAASDPAAAGKLVVGAGTAIIFAGSSL